MMDKLSTGGLFSLERRVAIVTGASRGIGASIAAGLAAAGAVVIGIGRSSQPDEGLPETWEYRSLSVLDEDGFERLCDEACTTHGTLDILVNAAGVSFPAETTRSELIALFDRTLLLGLRAPFVCCVLAAERMRRGGRGSIINVTSINSVLGFPNNPGYVAAKGGLRQLTKSLAIDLAEANIRVNNLAPGYIRTAMTEASYRDPERHAQRLAHMIIPRWGHPCDLIGAAIFLASDASSYMTGQDLFVDGGWTAKGLTSAPPSPQ